MEVHYDGCFLPALAQRGAPELPDTALITMISNFSIGLLFKISFKNLLLALLFLRLTRTATEFRHVFTKSNSG